MEMKTFTKTASGSKKIYRVCKCNQRHTNLVEYMACASPYSKVHGSATSDYGYAVINRCGDRRIPWRVFVSDVFEEVVIWLHPEIECSVDCTGKHELVRVSPAKSPSGKFYSQEDQKARDREFRFRAVCPKCEAAPGEPCKGVKGQELKIVHSSR